MIDYAYEDYGHLNRTGNHQGSSKTSSDHLPINNHRWRIWNIVDYFVKYFKRVFNIFCNIISRSKMTVRESACRICLENMLFAMIGCCKFCTNWNAASSTKTVVGYVSRNTFYEHEMMDELRMRTYKWRLGWSCGSLSAELRSEKISWKEKIDPRTAWRDKFMPGWNTEILEILFPFIFPLLEWRSFPPH